MDRQELLSRLELARRRVAELARGELPAGLTEPDPGASERWEAKQVWAHMAEFVGYWHDQLEAVIRDFDGAPVPFGRVKTDAGRIGSIEMGRHRPLAELAADVERSVDRFADFTRMLDDAAWQAQGLHPTLGVMALPRMVDRFVVSHLDEHADQLEGLRTAQP